VRRRPATSAIIALRRRGRGCGVSYGYVHVNGSRRSR
jgi:hypothetical protein